MKRILVSILSMASSALFAGETLFYEPFDSPESVAKYSSGAKLSFEKGKRGESGSLKIEVPERVGFGGLSLPVDISEARGGVLEVSGETMGENEIDIFPQLGACHSHSELLSSENFRKYG